MADQFDEFDGSFFDFGDIVSFPVKQLLLNSVRKDGLEPSNVREKTAPAFGGFMGAAIGSLFGPLGAIMGGVMGYTSGLATWEKNPTRVVNDALMYALRDACRHHSQNQKSRMLERFQQLERRSNIENYSPLQKAEAIYNVIDYVDHNAAVRFAQVFDRQMKKFAE